MLLGTFEGRMDGQGRVVIPQRFRASVQSGMVLGSGMDGCIDAYPPAEFEKVRARANQFSQLNRNAREFRRHTFRGAYTATLDRQGRVVIPPSLRQYAGVSEDVVIIGMDSYFEVWSLERWEEEQGRSKSLADLAGDLEERDEQGRASD
jgi:MraZ protein